MRLVLSPTPSRPARWRKVHLDFHNSRHVREVGHRFDADEFVSTLQAAHVDSIVVFAKDMHGYSYYPTQVGTAHPGLSRDLLGEQVAACRAADIEVSAYICTLWDHLLAETRPEWLSVRRDGSTYLPAPGDPPDWTALCASNEELVALQEAQAAEVLEGFPVDGIWFDMPYPRDAECFCPRCLDGIRAAGGDPYDVATQRHYQHRLHKSFLSRVYEACHRAKPGVQVDFNNQPCFGLPERLGWMDSIDIEALPTAQWGYDFFPLVARYTRTLPLASFGMTGRFLRGWGDFGGVKSQNQMRAEAWHIVSLGCRCDVGEQMPPDGVLEKAVYSAIGAGFAEIKSLEPWLEGSTPVAEAAMLVEGLPLDTLATSSACGLAKALAELSVQFDVVETSGDWEKYGLVVVEGIEVSEAFGLRLGAFVANGGRLVLLGESSAWGADGWSSASVQPAFAVAPGESSEDYPFALYGPSWGWTPRGVVLAREGVAAFSRSGEAYTSHAQSPFDHETGRAVASVEGPIGRVGVRLGELYAQTGYWFARDLLGRVTESVMPERLVQAQPCPILVTLAAGERRGQWLVHVFDSTVVRPSAGHPPFYDDAPSRGPVRFSLNLGRVVSKVTAVRLGEELPASSSIELPCLDRYELLVVETLDGDEG